MESDALSTARQIESEDTMKITITRTMLDWLDGTGLFQDPIRPYSNDQSKAIAAAALRESIKSATRRANGSKNVELSTSAAVVLYELADFCADAARDSAGMDAWARGELNSARSLMKQIERVAPVVAQRHRDAWRALVASRSR
jgi:hypothetical protein